MQSKQVYIHALFVYSPARESLKVSLVSTTVTNACISNLRSSTAPLFLVANAYLKAVCSAIVPAYQSIKSFDDF
jgi:hypothetical protein